MPVGGHKALVWRFRQRRGPVPCSVAVCVGRQPGAAKSPTYNKRNWHAWRP